MSERRWTYKRFQQRVQERLRDGKLNGGTEEGRRRIATEDAALFMSDDYESALAELRAELHELRIQAGLVTERKPELDPDFDYDDIGDDKNRDSPWE